jgi:hypothetical protein
MGNDHVLLEVETISAQDNDITAENKSIDGSSNLDETLGDTNEHPASCKQGEEKCACDQRKNETVNHTDDINSCKHMLEHQVAELKLEITR